MERLFTFGCSFTQYGWPTWADILGRQFDHYENWGMSGAGNMYIACAISECHVKNEIQANDHVIIMWSTINREDRYFGKGWHTNGNVYTQQDLFGESWIKQFADPRGYLIRDLAMINLVQNFLEQVNATYYFLSMQDIYTIESQDWHEDVSDVLWHYRSVIKKIRPSIHQIVFDYDWYSRPSKIVMRDAAINPLQKTIFKYQKKLRRQDLHPSPAEHLEYLDKVLPEISVDEYTRSWVNDITQRLNDPDFDIGTVWSLDKHVPRNRL